MMDQNEGVANALHHRWIPVVAGGGNEVLSLRDLFLRAHDLSDIGPALTPTEKESLLRFLVSVSAVVLRCASDEEREEASETGIFPPAAIDAFAAEREDYFWLRHPTSPLLQEWGLAQNDANKKILDLKSLHLHVPGSSSSIWAIRPETRNPSTDLGTLLLLLVVAWWQTSHGNGQDGAGRKFEYGAPGDIAVRPMSVHRYHENFGFTLMANIPSEWVASEDLPMWLAQDDQPEISYLASHPQCLWRTTYTRNTPLIHWTALDDSYVPTGYVIGPSTRAVPLIAATAANSLRAMHSRDYARLYADVTKKGVTTEVAVSALDSRISSTEGYLRWYRNHLDEALAAWGDSRFVMPRRNDPKWRVAVYSEIRDTQGNRKWVDFVTLDHRALTLPTVGSLSVNNLLAIIEDLRKRMYGPLRVASDGKRKTTKSDPVLYAAAKQRFYALVEEPLMEATTRAITGHPVDMPGTADRLRRIAVNVFRDVTEPLVTPTTLPQVAIARNQFTWQSRIAVLAVIDPDKPKDSRRSPPRRTHETPR